MNIPTSYKTKAAHAIAAVALYSAFALNSPHAAAQMSSPSSQPVQPQAQRDAAAQTTDMQDQITQLKQQVAQLQAALQQSKAKKTSSPKASMSADKSAMEMEDDSSEMGGMSTGAEKPPMGPMKGKMGGSAAPMAAPGCCGMSMGKPMGSKAGGMSMDKMPMKSGSMASKLPSAASGQPPHLLHIGANDFFLDHAQHIGLTPEQKTSLEEIKTNATQQKAASQKQIDVAEQDLWQLTSADQANTADIDKKVREIATMRADQQMTFIHAVSAASDVLTPDQRAEVVKTVPSTNGTTPPMQKHPMKMH